MELQRLRLVKEVSNLFENLKLDKTLIIACQHILKTNYQMFLSLFDKGLVPENTYILGKCYSTDNKGLQMFVNKGVKVHTLSQYFNSHKSFDEIYSENVNKFLNGIVKNVSFDKFERIILIDDGGFLIKSANELPINLGRVRGIEQTSSGYEKIKNLELKFPVINVARSNAKLKYESPFIAEQLIKNLEYELKKLKKSPKKILVLGNGPIGREISNKLKNKCLVKVFDLYSDYSDFKNIYALKKQIRNFDVIIGCSGKNSLPLSFYNSLKSGAVLVSASSSDREFKSHSLRILEEEYEDCHKNIQIRDIILLNSGFPLTFTKHRMALQSNKIQLTRALIFSAVCLASTKKYPKIIVDLDCLIQKFILERFK